MPRLSDTGLQEYDQPSGNNFTAWLNPKDLVGYPITIVSLTWKKVDDHYFPSGDFQAAHEEPVVGFTFDNPADGYECVDGYIEGDVYGFSTNAARIKSVMRHVNPEQHLPLEGVCILLDERGQYHQLYLGESVSGETATVEESVPTRPTTSERGTPPPVSQSARGGEAPSQAPSVRSPAPTSNGGATRVDRKTQTARS